MLGHKRIVIEMRIRAMHAVNLLKLPGAQRFVFIKAPQPFQQSLASQDFMKAGDAAPKAVGCIKESRVAVRDFHAEA
jgi:hypothetical protein